MGHWPTILGRRIFAILGRRIFAILGRRIFAILGRRIFACRNIGLEPYFPKLQVPSQVSAAPVVSNQMEAGGSQEGGDEKSPEAKGGSFGGIVEQASDGDWDGEDETEPEGEDIIAPLKSKNRSYLKETESTSPRSVLRGRFGK
jgi:hypothetical protein